MDYLHRVGDFCHEDCTLGMGNITVQDASKEEEETEMNLLGETNTSEGSSLSPLSEKKALSNDLEPHLFSRNNIG